MLPLSDLLMSKSIRHLQQRGCDGHLCPNHKEAIHPSQTQLLTKSTSVYTLQQFKSWLSFQLGILQYTDRVMKQNWMFNQKKDKTTARTASRQEKLKGISGLTEAFPVHIMLGSYPRLILCCCCCYVFEYTSFAKVLISSCSSGCPNGANLFLLHALKS